MLMTEVTVTVPDGVFEGEEFTLEYAGTQLSVVCPPGCQPGDPINLTVDVPQPQTTAVNIVVPDGCFAGDEFNVDFDGQNFQIAVPDGCGSGMEITVELPASRGSASGRGSLGDGGGMVVTDEMYDEAFKKASRMGSKPDPDILRWALTTYCAHNGDIVATFGAMGDDVRRAAPRSRLTATRPRRCLAPRAATDSSTLCACVWPSSCACPHAAASRATAARRGAGQAHVLRHAREVCSQLSPRLLQGAALSRVLVAVLGSLHPSCFWALRPCAPPAAVCAMAQSA